MKSRLLSVLLFLVLLFMVPVGSSASTFDNFVVYGDSLSDTGNVARFTDFGADIWVETLATTLGADLYDYAFGGATTWYDNPAIGSPAHGLQWQIDTSATPSTGNTLYSIWAALMPDVIQ